MKIQGIHHVAITVRALEEARRFYIGTLEFEELPRPNVKTPGYWLRAGNQEIHLIGSEAGNAGRDQHFSLRVDILDEVTEELQERGLIVSAPITIEEIARFVFIRDPSGNLIEFSERMLTV